MNAVIRSGLAAVMLIAAAQFARAEEKAYCQESKAGAKSCIHDSLERCQQMARADGGRCIMNPARFGTTGRGGLEAPLGSGAHSLDRLPTPAK